MTFDNLSPSDNAISNGFVTQVGYLLISVETFTPNEWQILTRVKTPNSTDMGLADILYFVLGYAFANMAAFVVFIWGRTLSTLSR